MSLARAMTEDDLLQAITEAATYLGWRWHHVRRSDKALQMGHSGFPDLVLAREGRVLYFELKSEKGQLTPDQEAWMRAIDFPNDDRRSTWTTDRWGFVIRPSDLDWALELLGA